MKKTITLLLIVFVCAQVNAQFIKEKSINASIGFGASSPYDEETDVIGSGFYIQGELVLKITSWFDLRPYAGAVFTKTDTDSNEEGEPNYKAETNAFLIGGKVRIKAPIPWVAPYIEVGYGVSIGSFRTFTPNTNIDKSGLIGHVPVTIGLELGPKHNVDIAFTYYYQSSVEQFAGAIAAGVTIPLGK